MGRENNEPFMTSLRAVPHGIEYLSIEKTERVNRLREAVSSVFRGDGFQEIIPPLIDYASTFQLASRSQSGNNFEFRDSVGEQLALRSDLTVQTLKAALTGRLGHELPARFYYVQRILKDCQPGSGQNREILQAGVEWIGYGGEDRFGHLYELACRTLDRLSRPYRFLYGDARFVETLLSFVPEMYRAELADILYYKDTGQMTELLNRLDIRDRRRDLLIESPLLVGGEEIRVELRRLCQDFPSLLAIIDGAPVHGELIYDFALVRQLSYYSGPVLEAYLRQTGRLILSGGFYDGLSARFTRRSVPACGFAVNLNELIHLPDEGLNVITDSGE